MGHKVGLLDADVYGPNVPLMMGVRQSPHAIGQRIQPLEAHGIKLMSMGFLNPGDKPLVWRGPMLNSVIQQFLRSVDWGELDYLVIDLPPGTGDVQLTLIQTTPLTGAVIVTTPSDVSLEDARKAVMMFEQVREQVLGIVENMSYLEHNGEKLYVFGKGGGERTAHDHESAVARGDSAGPGDSGRRRHRAAHHDAGELETSGTIHNACPDSDRPRECNKARQRPTITVAD